MSTHVAIPRIRYVLHCVTGQTDRVKAQLQLCTSAHYTVCAKQQADVLSVTLVLLSLSSSDRYRGR